jgi:hypothetical protein
MIESNTISLNYIKKVEYTGSFQGMRYMLRKEGDGMTAYAWREPLCFAKTDKREILQKEFPLTAEGKEEAVAWLNEMVSALQVKR